MTLERHPPEEDSPWEIVIDKPLARAYVQCKHCAGYRFVSDALKRVWHRSTPGLTSRAAQAVMITQEVARLLGFIRRHLVCAMIWLEHH